MRHCGIICPVHSRAADARQTTQARRELPMPKDQIVDNTDMDFINKAKLFESVCKIGSKVEGVRDLPFFELVDKDERFKPKDDNQNEASN